jgi:AcrR family transcriptional regulator
VDEMSRRSEGGAAQRVLAAAATAQEGSRREAGRELPLGRKATRTRNQLLQAAYDTFAANGYQGTSVADIASAASVSLGTYYQYFRDRNDIMSTLVRISVVDLLRGTQKPWDPSRGRLGLRRVLAGFVETYVATAPFQAVWEEVTHVDDDLASLRRDLSGVFAEAVAGALRHGASAGLVRSDLDPLAMATALTSMVDRYCYATYVNATNGSAPPPVDDTVDLLTTLWADAIHLQEPVRQPHA